eukprot:m.10269 g.10269  ORF g.10269 m.10269 type:complete len:648 (-) comp3071_c1_seq1:233-2176(-)
MAAASGEYTEIIDDEHQYAAVNRYSAAPNDDEVYYSSADQLQGGDGARTNTSAAGAAHDVAEFNPQLFSGAFWSLDTSRTLGNGFEELKKYLNHGNEYLKELAGIFRERMTIEETYSKSLEKLYHKTAKLNDHTYGSLKSASMRVMKEIDEQAAWHHGIADMLKKRVCDPMMQFKEKQKKAHKNAQVNVERALKTFNDELSNMHKLKRAAHAKSKETEQLAMAYDEALAPPPGKTVPESMVQKATKAYEKGMEASAKADRAYREALEKTSQTREDWETAMLVECKQLEECEYERITYVRSTLNDFSQTLLNTIPEMTTAYNECQAACTAIDCQSDTREVARECGTGPYASVHELYDIYEESLSNPMEKSRRHAILREKLAVWKQELEKREATRAALVKLHSASAEIQRDKEGGVGAVSAVARELVACDYGLARLHATIHKLRNALQTLNSKQLSGNTLQPYIRTEVRKGGMAFSELRLPTSFHFDSEAAHAAQQQEAAGDAQFDVEAPSSYSQIANSSSAPPSKAAPQPPQQLQPTDEHIYTAPGTTASDLIQYDEDDDDFSDGGDFDQTDDQMYGEQGEYSGEPVIFQCRAKFDYAPNEADELGIYADDILDVFEEEDETWWRGRRSDGTVGVFPASYVERLPSTA